MGEDFGTVPRSDKVQLISDDASPPQAVEDAIKDTGIISSWRKNLMELDPSHLLGRTFLGETQDDGSKLRATIVQTIESWDAVTQASRREFLVHYDGEQEDELVTYTKLLDILEEQHEAEAEGLQPIWQFKKILAHKGPLKPGDPDHKGSTYSIQLLWEDGTITWEPLALIMETAPMACAVYAKENGLLNTPGWKKLKKWAKREKKFIRMLKQEIMKSQRSSVKYMFGVRVPRSVKEAEQFDRDNGNTLWQDAIQLELAQLDKFGTFKAIGIRPGETL